MLRANSTWTRAASIATRAARSRLRAFANPAANPSFTSSPKIPANCTARSWLWSPARPLPSAPFPIGAHVPGSSRFLSTSWTMSYYCGFNSEASFGAWSYLIVRPQEQGGNVLVDSPRFNNPLAKRIEELGGVSLMLLSHRDDIADHAKFAAHFHCPRVMHEADGAAARGIERVITGTAPAANRRRPAAHPHAGTHARPSGLSVSRESAIHGRSLGVVAGTPNSDGLPRRLLVFLAGTDPLDGKSAGLSVRMGSTRPRPHRPQLRRRNARAPAAMRGANEEAINFLGGICGPASSRRICSVPQWRKIAGGSRATKIGATKSVTRVRAERRSLAPLRCTWTPGRSAL